MKQPKLINSATNNRSRFLSWASCFIAASLVSSVLNAEEIAKWDFTGASGSQTSTSAASAVVGITADTISRGSGVTASGNSNSISSTTWTSSAIIDSNDYYTFAITIDAASTLNLDSISFAERRSGTGIRTLSVRSSLDGYASDLVTPIGVPDDTLVRDQTVSLSSSFDALTNTTVTFRIYGYAAEASTGSWRIQNHSTLGGLVLEGTVIPSSPTLLLSASPSSFSENGGTSTGTVTRIGGDNTGALTVNLASNDSGEATVPTTVEIPANTASATFTITGVDDAILDGQQTVSLTATAATYADGSINITVNDDEVPPSLTLSPSPSSMSENGGSSTITVTRAGGNNTAALVLDLTSSDITEATVPTTVTIPSNEASTTFVVTAQDDSIFDGTQTVTITATDAGTFYPNGTTTLSVTDDDVSPILISQYYEGAASNKYIELYNTTASPVTLTGYRLTNWANAATENWKTNTGSPNNSIPLDAITIPANSYWLIKGNGSADPSYANTNANTSDGSVVSGFNGNDSIVLYFGAANTTSNIADAISFTNSGNEGVDKSFYRIANTQGYSLTTGETILNSTTVWASKTLKDVADATPSDLWYLNYYTAPQAPTLDTFTLGANAANSASPGATITFTSSGGTPLEYRISETADLSDATWTAISSYNTYELSVANGAKTVYFQLRNATGESAIVSDAIERVTYTYAPQVIISQYYDPDVAGTNSKYIELTNISTNPVDLTGYSLVRWTNQDAENWKYTGSATTSPNALISLTGLGTLAAGQTVLVAHSSATTPIAAASANLTNGNLAHTGNDSIGLYSGTPSPETLVDVISFTNTGNEGADKSFVRQNNDQGFNFSSGSNVTNYSSTWVEASLATVASADSTSNEKLGVYPGGGVTAFTTWATGAPYNLTGNDALFDADPDKDGVPNGIEFISGSNPTDASDAALSSPTLVIDGAPGARNATITYRSTSISDYLNPVLQISDDLQAWQSVNNQNATISKDDNFYGPGIDRYTVIIDANASKGFARLSAQSNN